MIKNIDSWVEFRYLALKRKYFVSQFWFYFLNFLSFGTAAAIVVLNLFAIKLNNDADLKKLFVVMAIISATITFLTTIVSFFTLKKSAIKANHKLERIETEYKKFKDKKDDYKTKEAEHLIIKRITYIFNED